MEKPYNGNLIKKNFREMQILGKETEKCWRSLPEGEGGHVRKILDFYHQEMWDFKVIVSRKFWERFGEILRRHESSRKFCVIYE